MDVINLDNGQTVLPDWAKETTMKKMASDMSKLSGTIKSENEKLIKAITSGKGSNSQANQASSNTKDAEETQKKQTQEIKKTTKEYSKIRGVSVGMGAAIGGAVGGLVKGASALTGALVALSAGTMFNFVSSLNRLTDVGLNQADEFLKTNYQLRALGMSLDEATSFALTSASAMQNLGGEAVNDLLLQFDKLSASGSKLGLTLEDNIGIFQEQLNLRTRLGNLGRLEESQREKLVKQTQSLVETQIKYTGALGESFEVIRTFAISLIQSSGDFQSRLLLSSEATRQEMINGAQEFVSILRATGGSLGGELAGAALEAASFGAIGFSESAKRFITVLPSLSGSFNSLISDFNEGLINGEDVANQFTTTMANLTDMEKRRVFAIARTGDQQAMVIAKGIMQFEKAFDKITDAGFSDSEAAEMQQTLNILRASGNQLVQTVIAVKDKFVMGFLNSLSKNMDAFNDSFADFKGGITTLANTLFGIDKDGEDTNEFLAKKLPQALLIATDRIYAFNARVKKFLEDNEGSSFTEVFKKMLMPGLTMMFQTLTDHFIVFFNQMMHRIKNSLNPFGYYDEDKFEKFLEEEKQKDLERLENKRISRDQTNVLGAKNQEVQKYLDKKDQYFAQNSQNTFPSDMKPSDVANTALYQNMPQTPDGFFTFTTTGKTYNLGSKDISKEEENLLKSLKLSGNPLSHLNNSLDPRMQDPRIEAYIPQRRKDIRDMYKQMVDSGSTMQFDADKSGTLEGEEVNELLKTLIFLTRKQSKIIEKSAE